MKRHLVTIVLLVLFSCTNNNLSPLQPVSFAEGDVLGNINNSSFSSHFRFEQPGSPIEKFEQVQEGLKIQLTRSQGGAGSPHITMTLLLKDVGLSTEALSFFDNDSAPDEFDFFSNNSDPNSPATLIEVTCKGFAHIDFLRSLSIEANKVYNLVTDSLGEPIVAKSTTTYFPLLGHYEWGSYQYDAQFLNTKGDTIHFVGSAGADLPIGNMPFTKIIYANGGSSSTDATYTNLIYSTQLEFPYNVFLQKQSDGSTINLKEQWSVTNGNGQILNYSYDYTSGHLTFAFLIKINTIEQSLNSTGHDLSITGKFDSGPLIIYHP